MTLRERLGPDVDRVHALVDELLDREDGIIVLVDDQKAINYARGFALSACQLELLTDDLERVVRAVTRAHVPRNRRDQREKKNDVDAGSRSSSGNCRHPDRVRMADERCASTRPGDRGAGSYRSRTGRVLPMASELVAPDPG